MRKYDYEDILSGRKAVFEEHWKNFRFGLGDRICFDGARGKVVATITKLGLSGVTIRKDDGEEYPVFIGIAAKLFKPV